MSTSALHRFIIDDEDERFLSFIVFKGPLAGKTVKMIGYESETETAGQQIMVTFHYQVIVTDSGEVVRSFAKGDAPIIDDLHQWANEVIVTYVQQQADDDDEGAGEAS